jgi:succinate-semialdehyde dehydrogenase/glutarate-semialdehyde dehydrogenase
MGIATVNPATGETLKTFEPLTGAEIEAKLAQAEAAFKAYRQTSFSQRSQWLKQAADILERDQVELGKIITLEMGKTVKSAIAEAQKCALVCRYYADNAADFLKDEPVATDASYSFIRYQPLGIILAVMPWNFPLWQVFRFVAPAVMAGNVGVLKHASNVPQCALKIEEIITEAGFPQGVFQTLLIGASQVAQVINDDRVKAATLTGSELAGASLASAAGKQIKKTVLELGGSDPLIVMPSADLEAALNCGVISRMLSNGQCCISSKRFIIHESVADEFEKLILAKFQGLKVGDPLDETTDVGPLATPGILKDLDEQVQKTVAMGAKVLLGGKKLEGIGNFYPPTILTNIPPNSPADKDEFFGPVASLFRVQSLDQAIALANSTIFGLGASAWTDDPDEQRRLINEIEAGAVFINGLVKSDPRLPFGGIKHSGYGRELGVHGIHEFCNIKTVWIK